MKALHYNIISSLQMEHSMHLRVLHLSPDLRAENIHFSLRIAQLPREESVPERLKAFLDLQVVPGANFFLHSPNRRQHAHCKTSPTVGNSECHN